jgi:hypothetical protein
VSINEVRSNDTARNAGVARVEMKLEVIVIPVSDVERSKEFYGRIGWRLEVERSTWSPPASRSASSSTTARKAGAGACIPRVFPAARAPCSAIPTATSGTCRKSRPRTHCASNLARLPSAPQAIWRVRFGVRRPPTASTRSALGSVTRTGQTGTRPTWWLSSPAKSCRNERLRRDRYRSRRDVEPLDRGFLVES